MARQVGLGKGLSALIPEPGGFTSESPRDSSGSNFVPVDKIIPNPRQPRHTMNEEDLRDLADSIKEHGIIQPLVVSYDKENDCYILIAGERRLRASRLAGLEVVPVLQREVTEQQQLELALIENVQRADLTPLETAEAYRQLHEEFNLSQQEIAQRVGKSRPAVANTLRLLNLPKRVQQALAASEISEGHARALLGLNNPQQQGSALDTILREQLNVRQTEDLVQRLSGERPPRVVKKTIVPEVQEIENRLRMHLGAKVIIRHGENGGNLVIRYFSDEELNDIVSRITGE